MLKRAAEKLEEREGASDDDVKDDAMMESSDEDIHGGESSSDDEEEETAGRKTNSRSTRASALPRNMPTAVLSSDEESDDARDFLANTMGLLKDNKDTDRGGDGGSSKIANDLDALFGKHL